jgi:hypothetical protein
MSPQYSEPWLGMKIQFLAVASLNIQFLLPVLASDFVVRKATGGLESTSPAP